MAGFYFVRWIFVRKRPKFYRTALTDFQVSYKTAKRGKGAKWKNLKPGRGAFVIPRTAISYRVRLRTPGAVRALDVFETTRKKSTRPLGLSLKGLLKRLAAPKPRKGGKYQTVLEYLNERLGHWRLSVGVVPLARYYKDGAFFTNPTDLAAKWNRIRIWYALESEGLSDGSPLKEDEKAYHIGTTYFEVKDATLGTRLLARFAEIVEDRLFHEDEDAGRNGIAVQHNANPDYKKWREQGILLATEGVPLKQETGGGSGVQRKAGSGRHAKRVRSRK